MRVRDVGGGWVPAGRNLSLNLETWWRWERRQQLARCSNALPCDVLGHETKPPQRWGLWPEDAAVHCWRGGIALIHPDSFNDVYFFLKADPDGEDERSWRRMGCVRVVDLTEGYIPNHRDGDILTRKGESRNSQVCLFSHWLKSLKPFLTRSLLATHYRLLCQRRPGGLRPPVFTCASDKARLCASSPQSCWPGPPQPRAPSGLGPGPPVSSP